MLGYFGFRHEYAPDRCGVLAENAHAYYEKLGWDEDKVMDMISGFYGEHGFTICELTDYVEGKGTLGITIGFSEDPTEIMPQITERLSTFPKAYAELREDKQIKILEVKLVEKTTTEAVLMTKTL